MALPGRKPNALFLGLLGVAVIATVLFSSSRRQQPTVLKQVFDADEKLLFSKAPTAVQQVLGMHVKPLEGSNEEVTVAAEKEYTRMLQKFQRAEATKQRAKKVSSDANIVPDIFDPSTDPDAPPKKSSLKAPVVDPKTEVQSTERLVQEIEKKNGLDGLFNPEDVMKQMEKDIKHPDTFEKEEEQRLLQAAPENAKRADESKLKELQDKVHVLEGLNARLALGSKAVPRSKLVTEQDAAVRANKVAQEGLKVAEAKADAVVAQAAAAGADPATQHALAVAVKAGEQAVKHAEKVTQGMLKNKGTYKMPKLPGVTNDAWAGVKHALTAGQPDARDIPGVKDSTWPFAPGSFRAKDVKIPGVNQDSWWVFEPGQSWSKDRSSLKKGIRPPGEGGCVPDSTGKLRCNGGKDGVVLANALDKAIGFGDQKEKVLKQPGEMQTIIPEIRNDAEAQRLNAAAAAFATAMPLQRDRSGGNSAARQQILWQSMPSVRGAEKSRFQDLEVVGDQCSNFLDCFRAKTAKLVDHHTQPVFGRDLDVDVSDPSQSVLDNFLAEHTVWKPPNLKHTLDIRVPVGGPNTDYIGHTSRLSVRDPSHVAHDVMADYPSSTGTTMYHASNSNYGQDGLQKQALAQIVLWDSMLADDAAPEEEAAADGDAANATDTAAAGNSSNVTDPLKFPTVCDKGVNCNSGDVQIPGYSKSSGRVCKQGVNCDSGFLPFTDDKGMFGDNHWKVTQEAVPVGYQGSYPLWTPYMYTPNKPTKWEPWMDWRADYGLMARRNRVAQRQMMVMMAAQQPEVLAVPELGSPQVMAQRPNLADGQMMAMVSPPRTRYGDSGHESKPSLMLEPEFAGEEEEDDVAAPRTHHKSLNDRGVKTEGYPEEIGFDPEKVDYEQPGVSPFQDWPLSSSGKLKDVGVNVDSGWYPYKYEQIWGYDERKRVPAKVQPEPEPEEEEPAAEEDDDAAERARREAEERERARLEAERLRREEEERRRREAERLRREEEERSRKAWYLAHAPEGARQRILEEEQHRGNHHFIEEEERKIAAEHFFKHHPKAGHKVWPHDAEAEHKFWSSQHVAEDQFSKTEEPAAVEAEEEPQGRKFYEEEEDDGQAAPAQVPASSYEEEAPAEEAAPVYQEAPAAEPSAFVEDEEEASKPSCGDKVMCGDAAAAEALGMRNGRVMIPEETKNLMDRLEKSDGARGVHNLEHAVKSVAGIIKPEPTNVQKIKE